ncbi:hypothetical protein GOV08_03400 [Candidatus Woesearchaeota archaeon]|nr:hypothetical protein [Candidatus Woesearchaeota archaeon]
MPDTVRKLLELVDKNHIIFTERGNSAIKLILNVLKMRLHERILIQDQGGWLKYHEYIDQFEFNKIELETDYGLVNSDDLKKYAGSVLLINSMPGYVALQDMEHIAQTCLDNEIFLINDVTGSIGTEEAKYGDVILGSFGNAKPIEMGEGGFIATDDEGLFKELTELNTYKPSAHFLNLLGKKLDELEDRLAFLTIKRFDVIEALDAYDIVHMDGKGINVIVKFNNNEEKNYIVKYCEDHDLDYTECPRYIRINEAAISIEIKRLSETHEEDFSDDEAEEDD